MLYTDALPSSKVSEIRAELLLGNVAVDVFVDVGVRVGEAVNVEVIVDVFVAIGDAVKVDVAVGIGVHVPVGVEEGAKL